MRFLATKVLAGPNEPKKKIYRVNFTEDEVVEHHEPNESGWVTNHEEKKIGTRLSNLLNRAMRML